MLSLKNLGTVVQAVQRLSNSSGKLSQTIAALSGVLKNVSVEALLGAASFLKLNANQMACMLSAKGLTGAQIASKLATMGLSEEIVINALRFLGLKDAEIQAALANVTFTTSTGAATTGLAAFTASIKAATTGLITFLATNPVGWAILAAGALIGVAAGVNALNKHIQELVDKARESANALSESRASVDSYIDRIDVLRTALDRGTLSEEEARQAEEKLIFCSVEASAAQRTVAFRS